MKLTGKVAVVTGGARDLGRAISVKLASEGAKVCLNYFDNPDDAEKTLAMIKADGGEAIAVQGDMTKAADVKKLFAEAGKAFGGKVDILVNVVGGIVGRKKIVEQDEAWYDFLMDVNMRSVFLCTREAVRSSTSRRRPHATAAVRVLRSTLRPRRPSCATRAPWPRSWARRASASTHWLRA